MRDDDKVTMLKRVAEGKGKLTEAASLGYSPLEFRKALLDDPEFAEGIALSEELALEPTLEALRSAARNEDHPSFMSSAKLLLSHRHSDFSRPAVETKAQQTELPVTVPIDKLNQLVEAARANDKELEHGEVIDVQAGPPVQVQDELQDVPHAEGTSESPGSDG